MYQDFYNKVNAPWTHEMTEENLLWLIEFLNKKYQETITTIDTPEWDKESNRLNSELFPFFTDGISLGEEWDGATELFFEHLEETYPDTYEKLTEKLAHIIDTLAMVSENDEGVDAGLIRELKNLPAALKMIELSM